MPDVIGKMYSDPRANWGEKGEGWLGLLKRPDGDISTELSVGVQIDGQEVEIPLLVPTLTADEVRWLLDTDPKSADFFTKMPASIMRKAISHATQRIQSQRSPFMGRQ